MAYLWDREGQQLAEFKGHQGPVYALAFSPDGQWLATGGQDSSLRLWDLTGQERTRTQALLWVNHLEFAL
jgi:WD40 repeat protein